MRPPFTNYSVRRLMIAVAILGLLCAWPGRLLYQGVLRRWAVADVQGRGGSLYYGDGGYAVSLGGADPGDLWLFQDAASVDLVGTGAGDADLEPFKGSRTLVFLNLTGCPITDEGLAKLEGVTSLKYLFLGGTRVTDEGLKRLGGLGDLEILTLDETEVGDAGLAALGGLGKLRELSLWGTRVTDRGAARLKSSPALKAVNLPLPADDRRGPGDLQGELPGVEVYRQPATTPR